MKIITAIFALLLPLLLLSTNSSAAPEPTRFVMQLTRGADDYGHRRAFMQLDKILDDLGEKNLHVEVVAYEDGIHALRADNESTIHLLTKLANRGVIFKACKISMRAAELKEEDFPLEVEFVSAGAPEMIRLQMQAYKYWRP